jgi:hypothetical protein
MTAADAGRCLTKGTIELREIVFFDGTMLDTQKFRFVNELFNGAFNCQTYQEL